MNLNDYIEKLRAKPERERERIAIVATGISFAIILIIWLISFSEMNKETNKESSASPITNQLEDLKSNIGSDRQSIEEMMQSLPAPSDNLNDISGEGLQSNGTENQSQNIDNSQDNQQEIPSLP